MKRHFWIVIAAVALSACAKVPYTDRRQLNLISGDQEIQLGTEAYAEALKANKISAKADYQSRVKNVGARIAAAAEKPEYKWEFNVLESKDVNAWCLPGGKVAFYEGIMPICQNDNGIAVVMGHEVAHALAHHGAERMSQGMGANLIAEVLSVGLGKAQPGVKENVMKLYGVSTQVGVLLPFGRAQESEADHIGLILMAKAGYDPNGAVDFWKRMEAQAGGGKTPEFLSTHPSGERRIQQIQEWLPEVMKYYRQP